MVEAQRLTGKSRPVTVGRERPPGKASAASIFRRPPKFRTLVIEFRPRGCVAACSRVCAEARRSTHSGYFRIN
jgi:hypothetical protein